MLKPFLAYFQMISNYVKRGHGQVLTSEYWRFFYPCLERNEQKLYSSTDLARAEGWLWTEMTQNVTSSPSYKGRGARSGIRDERTSVSVPWRPSASHGLGLEQAEVAGVWVGRS